MNAILESKMSAITELCRKYGVAKLEVFGSANTSEFDPETSDFDFILELSDNGDYFVRYMEFADALEQVLGHPVNLLSEERLRPRFLESIAPTREVIYASTDQTVAA